MMPDPTTLTPEAEAYIATSIREAHAARKIVAVGLINKGPSAGRHIISTARRPEMLQYVEMMCEPSRNVTFIESVCREIRKALTAGLDGLSSEARADMIGNVLLLMAAKLATGDEHLLDGSGLGSLTIVVDRTGDADWDRRGFLRPEDARVVN
jgi:hypothetical protein